MSLEVEHLVLTFAAGEMLAHVSMTSLSVYLAKDPETMQSRGFAFVSFYQKTDAESAMNSLQGYGYDHLILKLEWAKPSLVSREHYNNGLHFYSCQDRFAPFVHPRNCGKTCMYYVISLPSLYVSKGTSSFGTGACIF